MTERPLPWGRLIGAALFVAAAPMWWQWLDTSRVPPGDSAVAPQQNAALPSAALRFLSNQDLFARIERPAQRRAAPPYRDPVSSAPDFKRVFDQYIESTDSRERRNAVRAFEACVPAFLPAPGHAASPEPYLAALPSANRTVREAAYRTLFARCQPLLAAERSALVAMSDALQRDTRNEAPGAGAKEAALAGRLDAVEPLVSQALNNADPAAVASLAGLAEQLARQRSPDAPDDATLQRAREVDAALPLVACDLGLDCSERSLWALQLCAAQGWCEGDVAARLTARNAFGSVDRDEVEKQRLRLVGLIRSGRTLHTADVIPPP